MTEDCCPRCSTGEPRLEFESVEDGTVEWRIYYCRTCGFSWRDSEPPEVIDPKIRKAAFRLDPAKLGSLRVVLAPTPK